uniref:Kringle domain-containing protein n=1 Tax=Panagrellus redivivus TaxID=6233 RepID=A0A7E4ZX69_PANRE
MLLYLLCIFVIIISTSHANVPSWATKLPWCDNCAPDGIKPVYNVSDCLNWSLIPSALRRSTWPIKGTSCVSLDNSVSHFCPKSINNPPELIIASCTTFKSDDLIPCIDNTTNSKWYRGSKSVTAFGTPCLRWDTMTNFTKAFESFFAFETSFWCSSVSGGIHSHENYCRNPDSWGSGPWCYINTKGRREPCFQQCTGKFESKDKPCLSRNVFNNDHFFKNPKKDFYKAGLPLLSDASFASFGGLAPPSPFYSNPDFCYVHDVRAKVFGPWMLKTDPDAAIKEPESNLEADPWRRCFLACEDAALTCAPSVTFSYFGPKYITVKRHSCTSPSDLLQHLTAVAKSSECFNYGNLVKDIDFTAYPSLKPIADGGIGCFVVEISTARKLVSVVYEPCFKQCSAKSVAPVFAVDPNMLKYSEEEIGGQDVDEEGEDEKEAKPVVVTSENFKEMLDKGSLWPAFAILSISVLAMVAAIIVCGLHAFEKI